MHPMERQKVKNNTGFITNYSLENSILFEDIDFTKNSYLNSALDSKENNVFLLYPFKESKSIKDYITNETIVPKSDKKNVFIIIDSTWPCAKKIIRLSPNLKKAMPLTFDEKHLSGYQIKEQPKDGFISTIETAKVILDDLCKFKLETIPSKKLDNFLDPFRKINKYQLECINDPSKETYTARFKEK